MSTIARLQEWYLRQCNDDWEHMWGMEIGTLDNPGWRVRIDLKGTSLAGRAFHSRAHGVGNGSEPEDQDWWTVKIEEGHFLGNCGPRHLETVLKIFLDWSESETTLNA